MKIVCTRNDLLKGINIVSKAIPTRSTMAIMECILIDASTDEIKLTANDTELGIETIIDGTIEERGIVALDAKIFGDIVRKLPDEEVGLSTDEAYRTNIRCGEADFNIIGKSGEDFSYIPMIPRSNPIVVSEYNLKQVILQTIFSIADNDNNKLMTGELFEVNGNVLEVASLDGHRISIRKLILKDNYPKSRVVVPGKTLNEISRIIPGSFEENVSIYITENHIIFEYEQTTVVSRLIDGEYFQVEQMLSTDRVTRIQINRQKLLDCVDRATLLVNPGDKKPIIMSIREDKLHLHIKSFIGSMDEYIAISMEGKELDIAFNPKFLIDALRAIEEETITIYFVNAKSPCVIKDDPDNYTYLYLILPVNFNVADTVQQ